MFRRKLKPLIVGAVVFIAGLVSFFFIWAEADAIRPPSWARAIWPLVSFPVFSVTPRLFATMYFWELAFLNNLVWAALAAGLTQAWRRQSSRR